MPEQAAPDKGVGALHFVAIVRDNRSPSLPWTRPEDPTASKSHILIWPGLCKHSGQPSKWGVRR